VYGWLWSFGDSMPSAILWQTRIAFVLGVFMGLFGILAAVVIAFHQQLGLPACGGSRPF
jgi:cyanate permease